MIEQKIRESIAVKQKILEDKEFTAKIAIVAKLLIDAFGQGRKVLFCGNGGSAADAQHLAAEFSGRFYYDRSPLDAEALHVNTSYLTAVANDYSYDEVYSRLVRAKGSEGDVLFAISTSGNSPNIIRAVDTANNLGMLTIGLTGESGGRMKNNCRYLLNVPSADTPRVQEAHILIGHIICELVESTLFPK
ncbi:MAG TPA: D-sedoheptulose 7-phosphate isomerase [Bacteroidales bacterium]|nr:D-sedoheptulose 7-phosphate isomerase [Bacteroidales bacterium]